MKKKLQPAICFFMFFIILSNNLTANTLLLDRKNLFDNDWRFCMKDVQDASIPGFDDSGWRKLDLPHDWSIEGRLDKSNPMAGAGGYFPSGTGWYRKTFDISENLRGQDFTLYFEGVYMNAEVFVNGKSMGEHPYGYTSFDYNISDYLKFGEKNTIAVRVDNSKQINCRWYSGSGIYRHVWLFVKNPVSIAHQGVRITTPVADEKKALICFSATLNNKLNIDKNLILKAYVLDSKGKVKASKTIGFTAGAGYVNEIVDSFEVIKPELWSVESPNLYTLKLKIIENKNTKDEILTFFGIRTISFTEDKGFLLNSRDVILNGGCIHHDNGLLGATAHDRTEFRKVELMKAAGFNALRTSHNPPSEAFLDACDRLGMLVIDESFDGWRDSKNKFDYHLNFDEWCKKDIQSMVKRDMNHPSIIMWSIGNEIIERKKPEAVQTAKKLASYVKEIDNSRPVTSAMTTWDNDWEIFDELFAAHDIGGYNYQLHRAVSDNKRVPSRIIVQTESYPRDAFKNWLLVTSHKFIIGDFVWTAMDYLGESGIGRSYYTGELAGEHWEKEFFPWHGAYCGDVDLTGWRKPISHYRSMLYNDNEKLYMAVKEPHPLNGKIHETMWSVWPTWERWNWSGYEGKEIEVEVYSKYPKVRLYLNDKLLGEKPTSINEEFKAVFKVKYQPGKLQAKAVLNNQEVETKTIETAGKPHSIRLISDKKKLSNNSQDLAFINVEIIDEKGRLVPDAEELLKFEIEGPGTIAGTDNANLKDTTSYASHSRKTWNGRALVVIKSTGGKGNIILKVKNKLSNKNLIHLNL